MKNALYLVSGACAAVAGFLLWNAQRAQPVEEMAHRLEEAWADHHIVVDGAPKRRRVRKATVSAL